MNKLKVDSASKAYKEGGEVVIKNFKDGDELALKEKSSKENVPLFNIVAENEKNENFILKGDENPDYKYDKNNSLFLIVRSLKNEDGTQKGYNLTLGDIIRLGRMEYRVIEFQDHDKNRSSLFSDDLDSKSVPFSLIRKTVGTEKIETKRQCRICLLDEGEVDQFLVNPCNCKGTSEYVHIKCLQDWISSKVKVKTNPGVTCTYWKKLNCEVCKLSLPDTFVVGGNELELIPIERPETPYLLLERVFYDKSKESADNFKMLVLLDLVDPMHSIKLGRGHECDLRENDISVSRLHAFIKYNNGRFTIFDNNSKFGTLILLRKAYRIEKKKIALQIGRTVVTFSLKQLSINNIPVFKNPSLMEKFSKTSPKNDLPTKVFLPGSNKLKNAAANQPQEPENGSNKPEQNGSFLDD